MPIPPYEQLEAPALQIFADGQARRLAEVETPLAEQFKLSEEERAELLPSGSETRWHKRVGWACYDLYRAGLLERVKRGTYRITEEGKKLAAQKPASIDRQFLMQYPSFAQWTQLTGALKPSKPAGDLPSGGVGTKQTPEEAIETAHKMLQGNLKAELRELVKQMDPFRFEQLVVDLLVAMGYGGSREEAAKVTKPSHDEGIDGVINEDRLGLDVVYVQAKRWKDTVGRKEIQSFVGGLAGQQASKGIFITTSDFTETARTYARSVQQRVILIDGDRLAELMIEHDIGVSRVQAYLVKRVDSDYFEG